MPAPEPNTDRQRGAAIETVQRALIDVSRRVAVPQRHAQVVERAGVEIDLVASIVLSRLTDRGPMRLSDLAAEMLVAQSTAGRHAAQLDAAGWCARRRDPEDGRAVVVEVTEAGHAVVERLRAASRSILSDALTTWDDDAVLALGDGLESLLRALNDHLDDARDREAGLDGRH